MTDNKFDSRYRTLNARFQDSKYTRRVSLRIIHTQTRLATSCIASKQKSEVASLQACMAVMYIAILPCPALGRQHTLRSDVTIPRDPTASARDPDVQFLEVSSIARISLPEVFLTTTRAGEAHVTHYELRANRCYSQGQTVSAIPLRAVFTAILIVTSKILGRSDVTAGQDALNIMQTEAKKEIEAGTRDIGVIWKELRSDA